MSSETDVQNRLPPLLQEEVNRYWQQLIDLLGQEGLNNWLSQLDTHLFQRVLTCSPFIAQYCCHPSLAFRELIESGDLQRTYTAEIYQEKLRTICVCEDENQLKELLRVLRQREMVRIAWRDIGGLATLDETLHDLSCFADAVLTHTLDWLYQHQCQTLGTPRDHKGNPQGLIVIAMGKLGAHELNFSSDIDLIFAYRDEGEMRCGIRALSYQEFFNRLGQKLIKLLADVTAEGYVYRVDMRLRPFGDSGPLVMSFAAMEQYYTTHARDWERYAFIKARVAAGDRCAGEELLQMLQPFVYRRYIDFGAIQSLREMKGLIAAEVKRKGLQSNIKLGPGGIRAIEFIAQSFQLMRGGRTPSLRSRSIFVVLTQLKKLEYLSAETVDHLLEAYIFLRNCEHRLQEINDQQTQTLPKSSVDQARIALGMGFADWDSFSHVLALNRTRVENYFAQLLERPAENSRESSLKSLSQLWQLWPEKEHVISALSDLNFKDPSIVWEELNKLLDKSNTRSMSRFARERLDRMMPLLLLALAQTRYNNILLERLVMLIESISRRSVYLAMLAEHPMTLDHLIKLCSSSLWISNLLTRQPMLLDELLSPALYAPTEPQVLDERLGAELELIEPGNLEQEMNTLRHFKHAQVLRVAAADISGVLPVRKVSDYLTAIAETLLNAALQLAWRDMTERYGKPCCSENGTIRDVGFAIIAYGKLGGIELGYSSDLDIIFLHNGKGDNQLTVGEHVVDNNVFFTRLAQRIIHYISTLTPAGKVYDTDTRLRPSGASGLLVTSLDAYYAYQLHHAWTWEHQALVRARPIAGNPEVMAEFSQIRRIILGQKRDNNKLREDICHMRERMRKELCVREKGKFDLKQAEGGITDIEFMVQYQVLRWAEQYSDLLTETSNLSLLEGLARLGLLTKQDADTLLTVYFDYRAATHALGLQEQRAIVDDVEFNMQRIQIINLWGRLMTEFESQEAQR